jgi:hypothetical protein
VKLRPGLLKRNNAIVPRFIGVGSFASSGVVASPTYPASIQGGDLIMLLVENGGADAAPGTPAGFTQFSNSPQVDTSGVSSSQTRLSVFYKRATGAESGSLSITVVGDHIGAQMALFRSVRPAGNPFDVTAGGIGAGAQTSLTLPGLTTTLPNCLIVNCIGVGYDGTSTAEFSAWANGSLASITEAIDATDSGNDGTGLGMAYGTKTVAGVVAATTVTAAHSERHAYLTIALAPPS